MRRAQYLTLTAILAQDYVYSIFISAMSIKLSFPAKISIVSMKSKANLFFNLALSDIQSTF